MGFLDFFRIFKQSFDGDPVSRRKDSENLSGAGVSQPDAILDLRDGDSYWNGSNQLRETHEFLEHNNSVGRQARYNEYKRLREVVEIGQVLTVITDESCVAGDTKVATLFDGLVDIKTLAETKKEPFLVYCWDFKKEDYTLGWASDPRFIRKAQTIKIILEDGTSFNCTEEHRILKRDHTWIRADQIKFEDELLPFYRVKARPDLTELKTKQFPRIFTFGDGWKHERQFIDEWKRGKREEKYERVNRACQMLSKGLSVREVSRIFGHQWNSIESWIRAEGFSSRELKWLGRKPDRKRVIGVQKGPEVDVYDLSVEGHENFCGESCIFHNCQKGENGRLFKVTCENKEIEKEINYLMFHRNMLNLNGVKLWSRILNLLLLGDEFWELVVDPEDPRRGIVKIQPLPAKTMYRIETVKGKVLEFQQSKDGPDYSTLTNPSSLQPTTDLQAKTARVVRFAPEQIIHFKIGDDREDFYPYGVSLVEPARGPAHSLRMMEDAMLIYRLSRAPERRVFYIDVASLPPFKAEAFMERMKDQFRKKKVPSRGAGASAVDEKWHAPAQDEDYWIPIRPNSNTRIETLPGACLSLDTEIPLLDGRNITLQQAINEFKEGKKLWVYSCDPSTGEIVPGPITWAGVTRKNTQVLKVKLDNGSEIICTPDHKFPIIGRGYVEAKTLVAGDSLIPFYSREEKIKKHHSNKYNQVYDVASKSWKFVHRMVAEFADIQEKIFDQALANQPKDTIHHLNFNRYDNRPENLARMNSRDHYRLHEWVSSEYAQIGGRARAEKIKQWKEQGDPRYENFLLKSKKNFADWRATLGEKERKEVNNKISSGLKDFWTNLTPEKRVELEAVLKLRSNKGVLSLKNLLEDQSYNSNFREKQKNGWKSFKKTEKFLIRSQKISQASRDRLKNPEYKAKIFAAQTIKYPKSLMDFMHLHPELNCPQVAKSISKNENLMAQWREANQHIVRKGTKKSFSAEHVTKMLRQYGYKGWSQFKKERSLYNHKVVSIEFVSDTMDVGTLTIDGNEELHGHHNFAVKAGVFVKNSNLDEISDTKYFRDKLYISLNFPKNYFATEDVQATRIALSAQDVKFARMIERLQYHIEEGLWQLADRHLSLRGYPEEAYEDLIIKMTPPSDWREMSRNEVVTARINNANSLKAAQLLSDYDILVDWMKMSPEEAKEKLARVKIQKLEDVKLQVYSQNPALLGIGTPGDNEPEIGAESGGPNPMLAPPTDDGSGTPPPTDQANQGNSQQETTPKAGAALPDPSPEDIRKYDLGIENYGSEIDQEEQDYSVIER